MSSGTASVGFTGVQSLFAAVTRHSLHQPWQDPNPAEHRTAFQFDLPMAQKVTLEVQNAFGRVVKTLGAQLWQRGRHTVVWDQTDETGARVQGGMYFVRMQAGAFRSSRQFGVR